jgi:hypothetical protein
MKISTSVLALCVGMSGGIAPALGGPTTESWKAPPHQAAAPGVVSGVSIYGEYLMHHTVYPSGRAEAHFDPALPVDNSLLLLGAMKALARVAYGQHGIEATDIDAMKLAVGKPIKLSDFDFEYRFVLDGPQGGGIPALSVQRRALSHPVPLSSPPKVPATP